MNLKIEALLTEFQMESESTRRVLERVPTGQLVWRPHPTSTPLGILAMHIASLPGQLAEAMENDRVDMADGQNFVMTAKSSEEIVSAFQQSRLKFEGWLGSLEDATFEGEWRLCNGEKVLTKGSRKDIIRKVVLNHSYHHRGQLIVYLRMLGVPIPAVYGPSGDENPFQ
jgi:uncharacterized damage-inducible protein DinB